jgi:hypothetical protein
MFSDFLGAHKQIRADLSEPYRMPSRGRTEQTRRCCEQGTVKEVLRAGDRRAGPSRSCRGGAESKESSRSRQAGSEVLRAGVVSPGWCRGGVVVPGWCRAGSGSCWGGAEQGWSCRAGPGSPRGC